jgi:dGTPase
MRDYDGFEGNGQSLRVLSRLEMHTWRYGLDLTRRSLLGILKYPAPFSSVKAMKLPSDAVRLAQVKAKEWVPPKCYLDSERDVVDWVLAPLSPADRERFVSVAEPCGATQHARTIYKALDTLILELADDIAYGVHDFEDGVALGLLTPDHWREAIENLDGVWAQGMDLKGPELEQHLFDLPSHEGNRKLAVGALINAMVNSAEPMEREEFACPRLRFGVRLREPAECLLKALDEVKRKYIIERQNVQTLEYRGQQVVMSLFEAIASDPEALLGETYRGRLHQDEQPERCVCDYIAGMTDSYATRMYERLFVPRQGSVFERL